MGDMEGSKDELNVNPHDPGNPEDYAGEFVPDPWVVDRREETQDGEQLDSGAVPGLSS